MQPSDTFPAPAKLRCIEAKQGQTSPFSVSCKDLPASQSAPGGNGTGGGNPPPRLVRLFMKDPGEFMTVKEVADKCRVSESTVRRWIAEGDLPALKVGGRLLVHRDDISLVIKLAS